MMIFTKFLNNYKLEAKILFIIAALGVISGFAYNGFKSNVSAVSNSVDKEIQTYKDLAFPDLGIMDYGRKESLYSKIQKGKFLLMYSMSNCGACKTQGETLQRSNLYQNTGIKILIVSSEKVDLTKKFKEDYNLDSDLFYDENFKLKKSLDVNFTPTNFLINDGKIERIWVGASGSDADLYNKMGITVSQQ